MFCPNIIVVLYFKTIYTLKNQLPYVGFKGESAKVVSAVNYIFIVFKRTCIHGHYKKLRQAWRSLFVHCNGVSEITGFV